LPGRRIAPKPRRQTLEVAEPNGGRRVREVADAHAGQASTAPDPLSPSATNVPGEARRAPRVVSGLTLA
jgi:hypothetical protein